LPNKPQKKIEGKLILNQIKSVKLELQDAFSKEFSELNKDEIILGEAKGPMGGALFTYSPLVHRLFTACSPGYSWVIQPIWEDKNW
jgi:hypothetical protein